MTAITIEERGAIRESFARLLSDQCSEEHVRRTMASDEGYDPALWQSMADMGIIGLVVDPEHGGIGAGPVELEMIMEEAGARLLPGPLLSSAVLAAGLVAASDDAGAKARLLPEIASGQRIATVALTGDTGSWTREGVMVRAEFEGDLGRLYGSASFVTAANVANTLLVVATTPAGLATFEVDPAAPGVGIEALESWDLTQRLSRVTFDAAPAVPLRGADEAAIEHALNLARIALAGEQAGAARQIFDVTIDYLKTRVQFGRPIGGFQAIKHMAADLLIEVESATSAARAAAQAIADDAPDREILVNLASFACADAFSEVAAAAIQMHGGIAFTWEHPAHLYLRRARADAQLFGSSDLYRERYVAALENAS